MADKKKIWIISGEASGDIYGARLANRIKGLLGDNVTLHGMGGPNMQKTDMEIMVDSTELGVVGLVEVIKQIFTFIRIFRSLEKRAAEERPDAVILIDYPGFNIRFAKSMYKKGIPVIWYISPQVWAWRKSNIPKLATYCSKMMVIFPFETETYADTNLDVEFVGHPLVDVVRERTSSEIDRDPNCVLLLPGSRTHEIQLLLTPMLQTAVGLLKKRPELKFVIPSPREKIANQCREILDQFQQKHPEISDKVTICIGETAKWLQQAGTGLAASGTVTVECTIAKLPLVVIYKLNPMTFFLAKLIIKKLFRGFFTMSNIIANRRVFEEYLQKDVTPDTLVPALERILPGGPERQRVEDDMDEVISLLTSDVPDASLKAAQVCVDFVNRPEQ